MTKDEMVEGILRNCGISKANVERFYDGLSKLLVKELDRKGEVPLPGLGVLRVVKLKARTARNPRTGEAVAVPAKKTVRFRPYKELRDTLNPRLVDKGGDAAVETEPAAEPAPETEGVAESPAVEA
ncbi:MAG: HU family DNA-binding protein [Planctomycetota bacterium]|jgi:DNA-binding protein HU-beta